MDSTVEGCNLEFFDRSAKSAQLISDLSSEFWSNPRVQECGPFLHESYGYENLLSGATQDALKRQFTPTARHIRFAPDYALVLPEPAGRHAATLIEYKVTTTPRYTFRDEQWNFGQIEADSWENLQRLRASGLEVALVVFCPYHPRPLLAEFAESSLAVNERRAVQSTITGSRTDYINLDLRKMRTFEMFMHEEFSVNKDVVRDVCLNLKEAWRVNPLMRTTHAFASSYKGSETGFNWE